MPFAGRTGFGGGSGIHAGAAWPFLPAVPLRGDLRAVREGADAGVFASPLAGLEARPRLPVVFFIAAMVHRARKCPVAGFATDGSGTCRPVAATKNPARGGVPVRLRRPLGEIYGFLCLVPRRGLEVELAQLSETIDPQGRNRYFGARTRGTHRGHSALEGSFLTRKGQTWYVRLMVPKAHREQLGRTKYIMSLRTRDKAEANRLKHGVLAALKRRMADDLAGLSQSPKSARALLQFAEDERRRIDRGELDQEQAEVTFDVAVEHFLEEERKRLGTDPETGHPLTTDTDTRIIRAAHDVLAGAGVTLLERAGELYLEEVAPTIRNQTLQEKRRHIEKLTACLGAATDVQSINRRVAGRFVNQVLMREGKAPKTVKDAIGHLSAFFGWLERRGEVEANPFYRVSGSVRESTRGAAPKRRPWTNEELGTILNLVPVEDPLWSMVAIAAYSGMRREEVARLRVEDVTEHSWSIREGKTQAAVRTVPIHPALRPLAKSLAASSDDGYLIPGLLSGGTDDKRGHLVGKRFTQLRKTAGITDRAVNFHTLRNTFLQRCEEGEIPLATAKLLAGHQRTDLTYGGYSPGASLPILDKAIRKVTYGAVDDLVRSKGKQAAVTVRSRRRRSSGKKTDRR